MSQSLAQQRARHALEIIAQPFLILIDLVAVQIQPLDLVVLPVHRGA